MKISFFLLILIFLVPLKAQWIKFDLQNLDANNFKQEVEPFIKATSISAISHLNSPIKLNKRLRIGVAYSYGINISGENTVSDLFGGYPNLAGSLLISENLVLKGNLSVFNSRNDVIQALAYGFGLKLAEKENNNWKLSVLFSRLQGPEAISIKNIDGNISYNVSLAGIPFFFGLGTNNYKAQLSFDDTKIPNSIQGTANYIMAGLLYNREGYTITPLIRLNSDVFVISIEISGAFR